MRLAFIAPLAIATVAAFPATAVACSVDAATGPIGGVISSIGGALGLSKPAPTTTPSSSCAGSTAAGGAASAGSPCSGAPPGPAGGAVTNNFITNNFITNNTTTGNDTQGANGTATTTGQTLPFTLPAGALSSGGGGGGGGSLGFGGFAGSNSISGAPINPSSDLGAILAGGGQSSGGGGGEPIMVASVAGADTTVAPQFSTVASMPDQGAATTAGVTVASLPATDHATPERFVAMASPPDDEKPTAAAEFGFEGAPAASGETPTSHARYMLFGLIGVAVVGAGWAWKSALM